MTNGFSAYNLTRRRILVTDGRTATTLLSRLWGLIGHEPLRAGQGLLIRPCQAIHTFGMEFPVDAAFVDHRGCIVRVVSGLRPSRIRPVVLCAVLVIELPEGMVEATGTRRGNRIAIKVR